MAVQDVPQDGGNAPDWCHPAKLFVGGLPRETSTQQLRDHFSKHGRVVDCVVMRWSDGRSRGFGYITYDNNDSATEALTTTQSLGGRLVDVKRAVPGTNKVFVGGLPQGVTAAELRTYFATFGPVSDAVVMMDSTTGRSRGFGFVCFAPGPEGATAIATALANYDKNQLRGKWIEVKSAAPPQELSKAADAPIEAVMPPPPPPPQQGLSMMPPHMNIPSIQHYHAAAHAQAAHAHMQSALASSLPPHYLFPHSAMMSALAPEFVPDDLARPAPEMLYSAHTAGGYAAAEKENIFNQPVEKKGSRGHGLTTPSVPPAAFAGAPMAAPPPGLEAEGPMPVRVPTAPTLNPELPVYIQVPQPSEMKEMSCQTDGPACLSCGAAFGCGGNCPWTRTQLLGVREAVGQKLFQKEDTARSSLKAKRVNDKGGRIKASTGGA